MWFFASTSAIYGGNETPKKQSNDNYLTFTNNSANDIKIKLGKTGTPYDISLVYSTDNASTWSNFVVKTDYIIEAGKSFKVVAGSEGVPGKTINKSFSKSSANYYRFYICNSSGSSLTDPVVSVSGDITSLLNGIGGDVDLSSTEGGANYEYCFFGLFITGCKCITTTPNLPSTKLAVACYSQMFRNCTSLVSTPNLPATSLANSCYVAMFYGCTSLVSAPNLPVKTFPEKCYGGMFIDCTSLGKIPDLSHVTSISGSNDRNSLYMTFQRCTKLSITSTRTGIGLLEQAARKVVYQ